MKPTVARLGLLGSFLLIGAGLVSAQDQRAVFGNLAVETFARGLNHPWGFAFLPQGQLLVTERPGRMRLVDREGNLSKPLAGVPRVFATGQGGLLDVATDRNFPQNATIYFCYAEPMDGGGRTSLARARLATEGEPRLSDVEVIFRQQGPPSRSNHWGCRIVQTEDGNLFLTTGDHFTHRDQAQNLGNYIGKIVRIRPDGSVPPDNPFVDREGARPEIWSYGHRNMQGAALHPQTGQLWIVDHGARGGDEINVVEAGKNYGWPVITYGVDYSGAKIGVGTRKQGMEQPIHYWDPSIAPSGMTFYTGDLFPSWRGNLFVGALRGQMLVRLELDGQKVAREERLLRNLGERIRDVRTGPDGAIWLLTDDSDGRILRVVPAR
ncbi:MAG TPA: PQQ-dependent sugar dehydrogenase [Xanthobacteraceae bacterium]|nr:PQQ-dependent sugar dehydrogenase [Xanthobacteraceae bacterium]